MAYRGRAEAFFAVFRSWTLSSCELQYCRFRPYSTLSSSPRHRRRLSCSLGARHQSPAWPRRYSKQTASVGRDKQAIPPPPPPPPPPQILDVPTDGVVRIRSIKGRESEDAFMHSMFQKLKARLRSFGPGREADFSRASSDLRMYMRSAPHPVVLVSALRASESPLEHDQTLDGEPRLSPYYRNFCGAVVSSFTTVTMGPPAHISFNLRMPSKTLSGILHHGYFRIHLLAATAEGASIAKSFLEEKDHAEAYKRLSALRWIGLKHSQMDKPVAPRIRGPGVTAQLLCKVVPDKCIKVGDHMIVIAEVENVGPPPKVKPIESRALLMYSEGEFRNHGQSVPSDVRGYKLWTQLSRKAKHNDIKVQKVSDNEQSCPRLFLYQAKVYNSAVYKTYRGSAAYESLTQIHEFLKPYPRPDSDYLKAVLFNQFESEIASPRQSAYNFPLKQVESYHIEQANAMRMIDRRKNKDVGLDGFLARRIVPWQPDKKPNDTRENQPGECQDQESNSA